MRSPDRSTGNSHASAWYRALGIVLLAMVPFAAGATDVRLVNYVAYSYSSDVANLHTDGVANLSVGATSSPLRLELWAFASPYIAGLPGTRLATYSLPPTQPGEITGPIDSGDVPFVLPADGVWYFSMLLTEFTGASAADDGYEVRYWINFATPEYIGVPAPPKRVMALEYYNPTLDHYFITADTDEMSVLDSGAIPGWYQTGNNFTVWDGAAGRAGPVCRYYIPPGYGDSHFFSASADECAIVAIKFPFLEKESDAAFYIALPDLQTGACAAGELPVYRLWNGRTDANHRYTTSAAIKAQMIAQGYVAEGYGPDAVDMCSPQ